MNAAGVVAVNLTIVTLGLLAEPREERLAT